MYPSLPLTKQYSVSTAREGNNRLENIEEKAENAGMQHFLFSPQCFLPSTEINYICCKPKLTYRQQVFSIQKGLN